MAKAASQITWVCFNVKLPGRKGGFLVSFTRKERGWSVKVWQLGKRKSAEFWFNSVRGHPSHHDAVDYANFFINA